MGSHVPFTDINSWLLIKSVRFQDRTMHFCGTLLTISWHRFMLYSIRLICISAIQLGYLHDIYKMMTSSNGSIFRVTGPLRGEFTGHRWIPHKGQWRGTLMFSLICVWTNGWVYNRHTGDLRRHRTHYDGFFNEHLATPCHCLWITVDSLCHWSQAGQALDRCQLYIEGKYLLFESINIFDSFF